MKAAVMTPETVEPTPEERRAPPPAAAPPAGAAWSRDASAAPWVVSTYFAEGLPYSIVHQISAQFFLAMGSSLQAVGLTALYGFAWNFKFLWSPLVDIYGTTKRWLWVTEALLALVVLAIAWPAQRGDLGGVARALVLVSFLAATHDVAIDGFFLRALPDKRDQDAFSGLRVTAYRIALLVGNGALVALAGWTSWRWCFLACGALLGALAVAHARILPAGAPRRAQASPASPLESAAPPVRFVDAFVSFLQKPKVGATLAFILVYRAGDALMFAMGAPLMKSLGFQTTGQGGLGIVSTLAFIGGSMLGSAVIARYTLRRALTPITLVQGFAILLYALLAVARPAIPWIVAAVVTEQIVSGVGSIALAVFLMRRCDGAYKAAHFAIGSALMSVANTVLGSWSGYAAAAVGFPLFFTMAFAASLPGVLLSRWVPKD